MSQARGGLMLLIFVMGAGLSHANFIIGGIPAPRGGFPFMAGIYRQNAGSSTSRFVCGGSLINALHVLTAKHCVTSTTATYRVVLGDHDRTTHDNGQITVQVTAIKRHGTEDVAVLQLASAVSETNTIKFINLATTELTNPTGHPATAVGWGWTRHQDSSSGANILQMLTLPLQTDQACINDGLGWIRQASQLCAGYTNGYYINVCHGDSGSPLIYKPTLSSPWIQYGVVHGGHGGCSSDHHMAVFMSVPALRTWINDNSPVCFAGDNTVQTPDGQKLMKDLEVGDLVQTATSDGQLAFSKVISWLDRKPSEETDFIELRTEHNQRVRLTAKHLVYTVRAEQAVTADSLHVGDSLYTVHADSLRLSNVTSISKQTSRGSFSPLTNNGQIVVSGVHASCYAHMNAPTSHAAFAPFRWAMNVYGAAEQIASTVTGLVA